MKGPASSSSERNPIEEGTSDTQPNVPTTSTTSGTFKPALKTNTKVTCPVPRTPIFNPPKSAVAETMQARIGIERPGVSDVPERLRDILDVVVLADKRRGWPQESIGYHLHRRNIDKWRDPAKVTAALEESVQLGLLEKLIRTSKKNKNVKTYYTLVVDDRHRKRWLSISQGL
ncbi:hypothetical protein FRC04_005424 [Tulasnella sp. 424]|nr:hypothetical protein FRC04_005424 [Tulasnella sp. 424]